MLDLSNDCPKCRGSSWVRIAQPEQKCETCGVQNTDYLEMQAAEAQRQEQERRSALWINVIFWGGALAFVLIAIFWRR